MQDLTADGIVFTYIAIYFMPLIFSLLRRHNNCAAIGMLNLLLGWTVIGWVVALIWSVTSNVKERGPRRNWSKKATETET